jgi:hypothetical protein
MIDSAEKNKAALDDQINENPILEHLRLKQHHWKQLADIKKVLKPFADYTEQVSKKRSLIQLSTRMYIKLYNTLLSITQKEGEWANIDKELVEACKKGLEKFKWYYSDMREHDFYFIASVLDPQVKTRWLKDNVKSANQIIERIKTFLKAIYTLEVEETLPKRSRSQHKSLEYKMLVEYESQPQELIENDINKYFDSPTVKFTLNEKEDQTKWIYKWYNGNAWEYPLMARIARDYIAIPTSEADIEWLFSDGQDILGVWRWALQGKTLRALTLLKDELQRRDRGEVSTNKASNKDTANGV